MRLTKSPCLTLFKCFLLGLCLVSAVAVWCFRNEFHASNKKAHMLQALDNVRGVFTNIAQNGQQFQTRSQHVVQACQKIHMDPALARQWIKKTWQKLIKKNIYVNKRHKLLFCRIPKIGCSFWKRVFKVIDESNDGRLHLYDMGSTSAHTKIPITMTLRNATKDEVDKVLKTYTKFMFARDPFSRLFSAYMDKIFVPTDTGKEVLSHINSLKGNQTQCIRLLTFSEFCDHFSNAILINEVSDAHFIPIVNNCHPCFINFTYIGKMETFMSDTRDILRLANINFTDVTGGMSDIDKINDLDIVKDITNRVFKYHQRNKDCLSYSEVGHRIWRHFQVRGMLSKDIDFPPNLKPSEDKGYSQKEFLDAIVEAFEKSYPNVNKHQQREESMLEAYSSVSPQTLQKLARIFAEDCLMFNYSCDIERFQNSSISSFYFSNFS